MSGEAVDDRRTVIAATQKRYNATTLFWQKKPRRITATVMVKIQTVWKWLRTTKGRRWSLRVL